MKSHLAFERLQPVLFEDLRVRGADDVIESIVDRQSMLFQQRFDFLSVRPVRPTGQLNLINHQPPRFVVGGHQRSDPEFDIRVFGQAIGPVAAVVGVVQSGGEVVQKSALPPWILVVGAIGIVTGLATYGYRVMAVIGERITELTPSRGFAATLAAATTVVAASGTGLPISTTHTLVGAVLGVGIARGIAAINLRVARNIFMSWIVTLPAGAILSMVFFVTLKGLLG